MAIEQKQPELGLQYLDTALQHDPDHGEALLNSAILIQVCLTCYLDTERDGWPEEGCVARERDGLPERGMGGQKRDGWVARERDGWPEEGQVARERDGWLERGIGGQREGWVARRGMGG